MAIVFLMGVLVMACAQNEPDNPEPIPVINPNEVSVRGLQVNTKDETINMPNNVVFVKDDINSNLISYDPVKGKITFKDGKSLQDADIKVGDVLYSMPVQGVAPEGYILHVIGIQNTSGKVVFDVEEAGIADAFDHIDTNIPIEMDRLSATDFTVWDPFEQEDQTVNVMQKVASVPTRSSPVWDPDFSIGRKWDEDRYSLKIGSDKTTLEMILYDEDGNFKTKFDQICLTVTLSYDVDLGTFTYTFDKKTMVLGVDLEPHIGVSGKITFFHLDPKLESPSGQIESLKNKRAALDESATRLIGKKFCVASVEIPVGAASVFVNPRAEIYLFFKMGLDGELSIESGLEKFPVHLHAENIPYSALTNLMKSEVKINEKPKVYSKFYADLDLEMKTGLGIGLFCSMPKIAKLITDRDDVLPYVGYFADASVNGKAGVKREHNFGSGETTMNLHAEAYGEIEGYFQMYAHFRNDMIWNDKLTMNKRRWPEEEDKRFSWDTSFVVTRPSPVPYVVAPEHRAIVQEDNLELQWEIPKPKRNSEDDWEYQGLTYSVYCSTDKSMVIQSNAHVRIAQDIPEKTASCQLEKGGTYYWKVVSKNSRGYEYESSVYSFDTSCDGQIVLNDALARYLKNHYDALEGVKIEEDGSILRTPSNLDALSRVSTLSITDSEGKYGISYMDDLLMQLPSLRELDCSFNNLQSLYLVENKQLELLVCHDNPISSLPLEYTPRLKALNCYNNPQLKELDLTGCPELGVLTCYNCGLESLDLRNCQKLMSLYTNDNRLDFLDVSRCPNLLHLDFHGQSKERVTLRLTHRQKEQFGLFRPHVNTDYEYVDLSGILTGEAMNITGTTAKITVTILEPGAFSALGIVYSILEGEPTVSSDYSKSYMVPDKMSGTFTLTNLKPDTHYFVRGFARQSETGLYMYGNVVDFRTGEGEPEPKISLNPDVLEFGEVYIGRSSTKTLDIKNVGETDITFRIVSPEDSPFYAYPTETTTLKPGRIQTVSVTFAPTQEGEVEGDFSVLYNGQNENLGFTAWGTGSLEYIPVSDVVFVPDEVTLGRGDYYSFNIRVLPENATDKSSIYDSFSWYKYNLEWSTSDESVVRPQDSWWEKVYAVNAGSATVTVRIPFWEPRATAATYFYPTCRITVVVYIDELFIVEGNEVGWNRRPCPKEMIVGESQLLKVKYSPEDATETDFIWKSDDPTVATVSAEGRLTALKVGKTTIRCMVATEARGHIEVDWELEVKNPSGSHEGFGGDYWD